MTPAHPQQARQTQQTQQTHATAFALPEPEPLPEPLITQPGADTAAWVAALVQREIPVLADTEASLAELRCNEDAVDAHLLAGTLAHDPLMTLKLLRHVAELRQARHPEQGADRDQTDPETTTEALVMLGITPFFQGFVPRPSIEQRLCDQPGALAGLQRVLQRSQRAAGFAYSFALHRQDCDAPLLYQAALLHDFAELLLWAHAPALARQLAARLQAQPGLRSAHAQQALLNTTLGEVQQALMKAWRLPVLLVQVSDDQDSPLTQVRTVQLAVRLARHTADGWHNPALADDVAAIGQLLQMGPEPTWQLLQSLDSD